MGNMAHSIGEARSFFHAQGFSSGILVCGQRAPPMLRIGGRAFLPLCLLERGSVPSLFHAKRQRKRRGDAGDVGDAGDAGLP